MNNELENGFLAMHQALQEDKRLSGRRIPATPAFWFVTLDPSIPQQLFRQKVEQISDYLAERLADYSAHRGGSLTLDEFREKFLKRRRLNEAVFLFVYSLFKLRKLLIETSKIYKRNVLSSLIHARLLFDLSLVTEKIIEYKNPSRSKRLDFVKELKFLSSPRIALSSFDQHKITVLGNDFKKSFAKPLYGILRGRYHLADIENDFAIAHRIRNFGAHKIENQPILYNRMSELSQRILNALFFTIEHLY